MIPDSANVARVTDHLVGDQRRQLIIAGRWQLQRDDIDAAASQGHQQFRMTHAPPLQLFTQQFARGRLFDSSSSSDSSDGRSIVPVAVNVTWPSMRSAST